MSSHFRTVVTAALGRPPPRNKTQKGVEDHAETNFKAYNDHNGGGSGKGRVVVHFKLDLPSPPSAAAPQARSGLRFPRTKTSTSATKSYGYGACEDCSTPLDIRSWATTDGQSQGQPLTASTGGGRRSSLRNSPERHRASLDRVPEDGAMDFSQTDEDEPRYLGGAPLSDDPDDIERELEEELEEHGLYRGSYKRLVLLYATVPLTFAAAFATLAALPYVIYPGQDTRRPPLYMPLFPSPVPELIVSTALWSLFYLLQDPLDSFITYVVAPLHLASPFVSTLFQTVISLFIRISAINLLEISHFSSPPHPTTFDPEFRRVWWVALGWAFAEAVVSIKQGYEAIGLYSDVLVSVRPHDEEPGILGSFNGNGNGGALTGETNQLRKNETTPLEMLRSTSSPSPRSSERDRSLSVSPNPPPVDVDLTNSGSNEHRRHTTIELFNQQVEDDVYGQAGELDADGERQPLLRRDPRSERQREMEAELRQQVDQDIDELIAMRAREELEEVYGMPVIHIPVFLSCLHRINALLMSIGTLLLITHAYMQSTLVTVPVVSDGIRFEDAPTRTNTPLFITLPAVTSIQYVLSILHTSMVLPKVGVPAVVYTGSIVSLVVFMAGLGVWNGLS